MSRAPKFSIVIPTYNRLDFLKQALSSVWTQAYTDYEVIVVDDGSNDGTGEYLHDLRSKLRILSQPNGGPGAARNIGMREAHGEYIAFLDSDDLWFPWTLGIFARAIQEHRQPHILGGKLLDFTDVVELLHIRQHSYQTAWFTDYIASSHRPYVLGSGTCVLNRASLAGVKFLEDRLNAEDHDLALQLGTRLGFVQIIAPVTLARRRHGLSETGQIFSSISGSLRLLAREKSGAYPGGSERSQERRRILTRHTRPVTIACLKQELWREAWMLYRATWAWNASLGRLKYLTAFPVAAVLSHLRAIVASYAGRDNLPVRDAG
jgi:GT2 family glycosyltransferase